MSEPLGRRGSDRVREVGKGRCHVVQYLQNQAKLHKGTAYVQEKSYQFKFKE